MKSTLKDNNSHWRKFIWKYCLQSGGNIIRISVCQYISSYYDIQCISWILTASMIRLFRYDTPLGKPVFTKASKASSPWLETEIFSWITSGEPIIYDVILLQIKLRRLGHDRHCFASLFVIKKVGYDQPWLTAWIKVMSISLLACLGKNCCIL